eukprot:g5051.t1
MPQETYLERKLRQLGLSQDHNTISGNSGGTGLNLKRLTFRLYFPRPPYGPVEYLAAKQGDGLNFVGQLLGHGGCTLKKIQTESGARVEVHDGKGNLNGTHPSYTDPSLHAIVFAENKEKLSKAVKMISELLAPVNCAFEKFEVVSGGAALLRPILRPTSKRSVATESTSSITGAIDLIQRISPDENEVSPVANEESLTVLERSSSGSPWRRPRGVVRRLESPLDHSPVQGKQGEVSGKDEIQRIKSWNTWGQNSQDAYCQFTTLTQSLVSQYANQSMKMKNENDEEKHKVIKNGLESVLSMDSNYHTNSNTSSIWKSESTAAAGGSTLGTDWSHFGAQCKVLPCNQEGGKEILQERTESWPLSNLYEELVGAERPPIEDPSLAFNNHMGDMRLAMDPTNSTTSKMMKPSNNSTMKTIHQQVSLPHNI